MAEVVLGSLLTVAFEGLIKKLGSNFFEALNLPKQMLVKLNKWKSLLPGIQALLVDAEEKLLYNPNSNGGVKEWLFEIKNLAYDMEDVLDGFEVDARKRNSNHTPYQASTSKFIPSCCNCFKQCDFSFDSETISKVNSIDDRLQSIIQQSTDLNLIRQALNNNLLKEIDTTATERVTTCLPELYVYGREKDKLAILQQLLDGEGSSKGFSVVPILGMGGIGKTTLARLVYNELKPDCFELKAWVCVSDKFDVAGITRTILEAVGGKCDSNDLNLLQQALNNKLSNTKFLLVLDDIWNENFSLWDGLRKPFLSGAAGSRILVTTRNKRVAEIMGGKDRTLQLQLLKDEECLSILAQHALGQETFELHPNLEDIGEKLVKKCRGLPLAAKTLGGLLCGKLDPFEWDCISNSKIWELSENESDILPALRLSYLHLPSYLKPCFAFCATFPKDYMFYEKQLVLLWMAEGILKEPSEEVGHRYFSELVSRAFFQQLKGDESRYYVMHDLIHDLAQFIAGEMCFDEERMLEVDKKSKVFHEKVRHLSFSPERYDVSKRFEYLKQMRSLRTFLPASTHWFIGLNCLSNEVVHDWLPRLKCLKALSLEGYQIAKLPDSIGDLKCLTYLNLCSTEIESLPESVGFLIKLQSLVLRFCRRFRKFPRKFWDLNELYHLDVSWTDSLKEIPLAICNLKNLVTMTKFIVGKTNESLRLYHLENFSQLRGELSIVDLHNVSDVADATKANLGKISGLHTLFLEWTSDFGDSRDECNIELQVLNRLKPHPNLKRLEVVSYGGKEFSSWICDPSFSNLSYLELRGCKSCTSLPSLGLLPALEELAIREMDAVKVVGHEFFGLNGTFPSLVTLVLSRMLTWEEWTFPVGGSEIFPCLDKLVIRNCPVLIGELPSRLSSLVMLLIDGCPKLRSISRTSLPSCQELEIEDCEEMSKVDLTSFTKLERLTVSRCSSLEGFAGGKIPITLKYLRIDSCENLKSLPDWELMQGDIHDKNSNLPSLKKFKVVDCKKLKSEGMLQHCATLESISIGSYETLKSFLSLGSHLIKLERLKIFSIEGCESLPEVGLSIPCLKYLSMDGCPSIESIPDGSLPPNLSELRISRCENLKALPKSMYLLTSLEILAIQECPGIECISDGCLPPNLAKLDLSKCENLKSLPDSMVELTSLQELTIFDGNLMAGWGNLHSLTSLQRITISKACPPDLVLPSSVTYLQLSHLENQKSIPKSLFKNLHSLQRLGIENCPKLQSLPKEAMPPFLGCLSISKCPLVKRQRFEAKGDYWPLTRNIPCVEIDWNQVLT